MHLGWSGNVHLGGEGGKHTSTNLREGGPARVLGGIRKNKGKGDPLVR